MNNGELDAFAVPNGLAVRKQHNRPSALCRSVDVDKYPDVVEIAWA
jgi:hypothetical protein